MKVAFYKQNCPDLAEAVAKRLMREGLDAIAEEGCLCNTQSREKYDAVLLHTHDEQECFEKVRQIIMQQADIAFYVMDINGTREQQIGRHPNAKFLQHEYFSRFLEDPKSHILAKQSF